MKNKNGKHAYVFKELIGDEFEFINPHYEDDINEPDTVKFKEDELISLVDNEIVVGSIVKYKEDSYTFNKSLHNFTIVSADIFLNKFKSLYHNRILKHDFIEISNSLLKPFVIDLLAMMELLNEVGLAEKLRKFQSEVVKLRNSTETIVHWNLISLDNVESFIIEYKSIVIKYLSI